MLGIHVNKASKILNGRNKTAKTMLEAIKRDVGEFGLTACQIFTHGPRNRSKNQMDYPKIKEFCQEQKVELIVHASYPSSTIWKVDNANKNSLESKTYIDHIADQLKSCEQIGASGFVLHLPTKEPSEILETLLILKNIIKQYKTPIMLEIESHKYIANKTYATPVELKELYATLQHSSLPNDLWGICVDTAHLWGSGIDISSLNNFREWLAEIGAVKNKIMLFHLNGSETLFGNAKDVHAIALSQDDQIWSKYEKTVNQSSVVKICKFCKKNDIPIICEINRGSLKSAITSLNTLKHLL